MSEQNEYAVTAWGEEGGKKKSLTLPSGQRCLVQLLEMEDVIALGVVDQLDTFTGGMLSEALSGKPKPKKTKKDAKKEEATKWMEALKDQAKFLKLMDAVEKIIMRAVLKPKIYPEPLEEDGSQGPLVKGRAYIHQVSFTDKMEIFGVVFQNLGDMSSFHEGQTPDLGDVATSEGLPRPTIPTTGNVGDQGVLL